MLGALLERSDQVPSAWTRSTVHDFFRKTNWDNRPVEPPRAKKISPYELTVSQFFQEVDWQWVAPVRSRSVSIGESAIGSSAPNLETTLPGLDDLGLDNLGLDGTNAIAADEGLTLDGFTDLF